MQIYYVGYSSAHTLILLIWACCSKIDVVVTSTGSIQPVGNINVVKSYSSGTVKSINAVEGQYVNQGDVLIELDTEALDIDVNQWCYTKKVDKKRRTRYNRIKRQEEKNVKKEKPTIQ